MLEGSELMSAEDTCYTLQLLGMCHKLTHVLTVELKLQSLHRSSCSISAKVVQVRMFFGYRWLHVAQIKTIQPHQVSIIFSKILA